MPADGRTAGSYVVWFDNTGGNATGVAVANDSAQAANAGMIIRDDTGAVLSSTSFALLGQGHTSLDLAGTYRRRLRSAGRWSLIISRAARSV